MTSRLPSVTAAGAEPLVDCEPAITAVESLPLQLRAIKGGRQIALPIVVPQRLPAPKLGADCSAGPNHALNLGGIAGEAVLMALALALASGDVGAAYVEGIAPRARATRARGAEFAASALSRDGHTVAAWGRLCFGARAADPASSLMPSLVVFGPGDDRGDVDYDLIITGPECDPALVELLRDAPRDHGGAPVVLSAGKAIGGADFEVSLSVLERFAVARAVLPAGSSRRTLLEVAEALTTR